MKTIIICFILLFVTYHLFASKEEDIVFKDTLNLSSLNDKDSIVLIGYIADCGEFGGHKEFITIKKTFKGYSLIHRKEEPCEPELKTREIPKFIIEMNDSIMILIRNYFLAFPRIGKDCNGAISNAPTEFWIETPEWKRYRTDECGHFKGFIKLRNELFGK